MIPDPQMTAAEVREIVLRELRNSDLNTRLRQLQGLGAQVVFNQEPGPLTLSMDVEAAGGSALAVFSGSGFRPTTAGFVTVDLYVDGASVTGSSVHVGEVNSHRATVPGVVLVSLAQGPHTWELRQGGSGGSTDVADRFSLVLISF